MKLDPLHQLIMDFIQNTNRPIFMTGKAGTGKTTFLHYIRTTVSKNLAVVAPTAVAAINAGGVTIHSFFQIPFGPTPPTTNSSAFADFSGTNYSPEKSKLIKCLDLLIIDEISMVRADTMDYIDGVLRFVKGNNRPFGGIQLLMIGDLYQLSPVYQNDWHLLKAFYRGPYFFDSLVFKKQPIITFELTKVHRQKDPDFIEVLNNIRNGTISEQLLEKLNKQYRPIPENEELASYVTLTTHNPLVKQINEVRLTELSGPEHHFKAVVSGDFPKEAFPTDEELILKVGALVMFIRNDTSGKKQYYNGRTAKITSIYENSIKVAFMDDDSEFELNHETWENTKYALSETDQKISESSAGSFSQFPIRLAWAITIHKSQGLTFEKAIIDVSAAFAHGQTYVALSRCRNLDGLILKEKVKASNIITDPTVKAFMKNAQTAIPDLETLNKNVRVLELEVLEDIFDFSSLTAAFKHFQSILKTKLNLEASLTEKIELAHQLIEQKVRKIGERFIKQELSQANEDVVLDLKALSGRLSKASAYFLPHLSTLSETCLVIHEACTNSIFNPDYFPTLNQLSEQIETKINLFKVLPSTKNKADFESIIKNVAANYKALDGWNKKETYIEKPIENPQLYAALADWRKLTSERKSTSDYAILSNQAMADVAAKVPRSLKQLSMVKNFGEGKTAEFGEEILKIIRQHLGENELFF